MSKLGLIILGRESENKRYNMEKAIAIIIPISTPRKRHPRKDMNQINSSPLSDFHNSGTISYSNIGTTAPMMMAASEAVGIQ